MKGERFHMERAGPAEVAAYVDGKQGPLTDAEIKGALLLLLRRSREQEERLRVLHRQSAKTDSLDRRSGA